MTRQVRRASGAVLGRSGISGTLGTRGLGGGAPATAPSRTPTPAPAPASAPASAGAGAGAGAGTAGTQDDYIDRLMKLIPADTVALYLSLDGIVRSGLKGDPALSTWMWALFVVVTVGNVLYWRKTGVTDVVQYVVLTLAFVVWVFTIGGPFHDLPWYKPFMGSVLLGLFTFFAPLLYKGAPQPT